MALRDQGLITVTPEQMADSVNVWAQVAMEHPEFTHACDITNNYHAVREIVLSGSLTWRAANGFFWPWRGKKVMDVGANAGIYTALCAVNGAEVVAYEPSKVVFELLTTMLRNAGLEQRVKAVNAAVWVENGSCPYIGHRTPNEDVVCYNGGVPTSGVVWTRDDFRRAEIVPCISFDDAIGDTEWDMVKVDIEGGEFEMLLAASIEKLKQIKFMYVEFHDWALLTHYDRTIRKLEEVFRCEYFRAEGSSGRYEAAYLFRK